MLITKPQLARLQVLYGQLAAHEIGLSADRESRLRWASERLQREIASFKQISLDEANFLIDSVQQELGVKVAPRKRPGAAQARRAGLDGRNDGEEYSATPQIATTDDLARIQRMLDQLGWQQETFRTFLESARSPLAKRGDKTIRTTADANKVWWALKRIARRKGLWRKRT